MLRSQPFYLCSIIFMFYLVQPTEAQITAPWEVDALKAIKGSLVDPQGRLNSWNRGDPCMGKWSHVLCYNATASDGYLHVLELQLLQLDLAGTLAPELGRLSHMQIMDFMWNNISGSIPKEVGNITSLKLLGRVAAVPHRIHTACHRTVKCLTSHISTCCTVLECEERGVHGMSLPLSALDRYMKE